MLIADDDAIVLRALAARLKQIGCTCHTAISYDEALEILKHHSNISVVLADHGIQGDDTAAFVSNIRSHHPGTIIIGSSGRDCRGEFASHGVDRFLQKPWGPDELIELISGRITRCVDCGLPLPLRRPFPEETPLSWICGFCNGRYSGIIDLDTPEDLHRNVRRADSESSFV
ncbi:MAG: response regulator [Phycisphaerae bacterium]